MPLSCSGSARVAPSVEYRPRQVPSRSIFPEVRVSRVSTSASRGTRGVGSRSRSAATDSPESKPSPTATYPTSRVLPDPVRRTAAAAPVTPGRAGRCRSRRGSIRRPPPSPGRRPLPEDQPRLVVADQVATSSMPAPQPRGRHRGVLLGVFDGVEYRASPIPPMINSRSPRARRVCRLHRPARSQPSRGRPMRTVALRPGCRARHHGRLGGSVGVPDLALGRRQTCPDLRRAGLHHPGSAGPCRRRPVARRPPALAPWRRR